MKSDNMYKIGFVGLGKLGLPCALSIENKGHQVVGYDINQDIKEYIKDKVVPYEEEGVPELLKKTKIKVLNSIKEVIKNSDIVFVPIQTPHKEQFEGITRLPKEREDFDYSYLRLGVKEISQECLKLKKDIVLVIISTVLPGTIEREIKPLLNKYTHLVYNPFFIAMGTTIKDFENPEFVLIGFDNDLYGVNNLKLFYKTIHNKPCFITSIINAELIKMVYNTYISSKIAYINTIMEICEKMGADVDVVSDALSLATDRIISSKYLRGGMGDGGSCHPRDNIALSWLARELDLSYDYFEQMMIAREKQTEWLVIRLLIKKRETNLPIVICGISFKKNINLTIGSPVLLLTKILNGFDVKYEIYDPIVYPSQKFPNKKAIYFIGMNHSCFDNLKFPEGSVVIDPWKGIGRNG